MDPVLDQICQFFGGPYDAVRRAYTTPTITGVGQVKRGFEKNIDFSEFVRAGLSGQESGCQIIVMITDGVDRRLTVPAVTGFKHTSFRVMLHCFIWSTARYVEDTQDFRDDLRIAIINKLRTDPTCGSGGLEAGGFHIGIPDRNGSGGDITWMTDAPETDEQSGTTKLYLRIECEAHQIPVG